MKFFLTFLFVLFVLSAQAGEWRELRRGLAYQQFFLAEQSPPKSRVIHSFKINLDHHEIKTLTPLKPLEAGVLLAINANFFDEQNKVLGLVIQDGVILNPLKNISWWGVFYLEKKQAHIVASADFRPNQNITQAVQAGPRLLVSGAIPKLKPGLSAKSALCINASHEVLLIATQSQLEVMELAQLLQYPENRGGLGCIDALNLDGGASTQLYVRSGDFKLDLASFVKVPVGLGVRSLIH